MKFISKKPFFTIITCTKNSGIYLGQNINSVNIQTFKNYEHIFIDGKSSDTTLTLIRDYIKGDDRVKKFSYPPKGISNAFNLGIRHSRGKFLIFLNSDDYLYDKHVLNNLYFFLNANLGLDWIYGKICEVNEGNISMGIFPKQKIFHRNNYFLLKFVNYVPHQAVVINREVFARYGKFDERAKYLMDYEYWLRIGNKTKWSFCDVVVSNYRYWSDGNSSAKKNHTESKHETIELHKKYLNLVENFIYPSIYEILYLYGEICAKVFSFKRRIQFFSS
jgi:glycosyltransferase involved in cell wall biosynthesis